MEQHRHSPGASPPQGQSVTGPLTCTPAGRMGFQEPPSTCRARGSCHGTAKVCLSLLGCFVGVGLGLLNLSSLRGNDVFICKTDAPVGDLVTVVTPHSFCTAHLFLFLFVLLNGLAGERMKGFQASFRNQSRSPLRRLCGVLSLKAKH